MFVDLKTAELFQPSAQSLPLIGINWI